MCVFSCICEYILSVCGYEYVGMCLGVGICLNGCILDICLCGCVYLKVIVFL